MIKSKGERIYQIAINIILTVMCLLAVIPIWLMFMSSLTDNDVLISAGYHMFPTEFSLEAYRYLFAKGDEIGRSFLISVFITVVGTFASIVITPLLAYPLSRKDFCAHNVLSFVVFFTMLFNGGIVSGYIMWTQVFHIRNSIWALIIPGLMMNAFNVILMKNYFAQNIPPALIEAAKIDGAGEFYIFWKIILPLSLPILATVGLMVGIGYWNDWTNGLYYVTKTELFSLQNYLNRINQNIQFLASSTVAQSAGAGNTTLPSVSVRMAIAMVGCLPVMLLYPFFQKYFVKGITIGAVKG